MAKKKASKIEKVEDVKKGMTDSIPPEKYFVLHSGIYIRNIEELAHLLDSMSDGDYGFHVTESKNDFANWIKDVFNNPKLAEALSLLKDKKESQILLLKHVLRHKQ